MATPPTVTLPADLVWELTRTLHDLKRVFEPAMRRDGHHAQFRGPWWQQPWGVYVDNDDAILLTLVTQEVGGDTFTLTARIITDDGRVHSNSVSMSTYSSGYTSNYLTLPCWEGLLVGVTVTQASGFVASGTTHAAVTLVRNTGPDQHPHLALLSGYLTTVSSVLGWPGTLPDPANARGGRKSQTYGAPAAGADISVTTATSASMRPTAISATLTTSATVANRIVTLKFTDFGGAVIWQSASRLSGASAQQASTTWTYQWGAVLGYEETVAYPIGTGTESTTSIPDIVINGGGLIQTVTSGLQAADQWSGLTVQAEFWVAR